MLRTKTVLLLHRKICVLSGFIANFFASLYLSSGLYGLPRRNGKLKEIDRFDAAFFGVHPKQAHTMDPQLRLMLEISYEAIVDGGQCSSNSSSVQFRKSL